MQQSNGSNAQTSSCSNCNDQSDDIKQSCSFCHKTKCSTCFGIARKCLVQECNETLCCDCCIVNTEWVCNAHKSPTGENYPTCGETDCINWVFLKNGDVPCGEPGCTKLLCLDIHASPCDSCGTVFCSNHTIANDFICTCGTWYCGACLNANPGLKKYCIDCKEDLCTTGQDCFLGRSVTDQECNDCAVAYMAIDG